MSALEDGKYLLRENFDGSRLIDYGVDLGDSVEAAAKSILGLIGKIRENQDEETARLFLDGFMQVINYLLEVCAGKSSFRGAKIYSKDGYWGITEAGSGLAMDLIQGVAARKGSFEDIRRLQAKVMVGDGQKKGRK